MAKKPKEKSTTLSDAEKYIIQQNVERLERQRVKPYSELLSIAQQNASNPSFQQLGTMSPYEGAAPYYGDEMQREYLAAAEYAQNLAKLESPKVTIDPSFYSKFTEQIPIRVGNLVPGYRPSSNVIQMASPELFRQHLIDVGQQQKVVEENNFSPTSLQEQQVNKNLQDYWRDTLEHESVHAVDKLVKYNVPEGGQDVLGLKYGHLATESHIPVGLSKIQREQYAITGKRIESPQEFKNFIFEIAGSKDPEEKINAFSEEAKRALRVQIQNAKELLNQDVQSNYLDKIDAIESKNKNELRKTWKKMPNIDFLEKSAQLIPALVEYRQASLPTA